MVPNVHSVIRCAPDIRDELGPRADAGVGAEADSCSKSNQLACMEGTRAIPSYGETRGKGTKRRRRELRADVRGPKCIAPECLDGRVRIDHFGGGLIGCC